MRQRKAGKLLLFLWQMGSGSRLVLWLLWVSCCSVANGLGDKEREGGLELYFYKERCPGAELSVEQAVRRYSMLDASTASGLLRLAFHDCQVDGCDGSVLLSDSDYLMAERASEKNFGIRKLDVINEIKSSLEQICPSTVSCADIIQLAAREAIHLSGGPYINVHTGRRDAIVSRKSEADEQLPPADITVDELINTFRQKNITTEEAVALMGGHTLGVSHCRNFQGRLWPLRDPAMAPLFSVKLKAICPFPSLSSSVAFAYNDATLYTFDNQYFNDVLNGRGLLQIDSDISMDPRTSTHVANFAVDQQLFFARFSSAFLQLSRYKVLVGDEGEIRNDCRFTN